MAAIDTVQKLLAKAHSSEFPEEAEAFLAKATELMAQNGISEAALRAASPGETIEIIREKIKIEGAWKEDRCKVQGWILQALGVEVIHTNYGGQFLECFATRQTMTTAREIAAMAEIHCVREMNANLPAKGSIPSVSKWKHSFLVGYGMKLAGIIRTQREQAERESLQNESASTALVLVDDRERAKAEVDRAFPHVRTTRTSVSDSRGYGAGQSAAEGFTGMNKEL